MEEKPTNEIKLSNKKDYPKNYYSFIDKIEEMRNGVLEIHLGSIKVEELDILNENPNSILKLNSYEIIIVLTQDKLIKLFGTEEEIDQSWFLIYISDTKSEYSSFLYEELSSEEPIVQYKVFIDSTSQLEETDKEKLSRIFSFKKKDISTRDEIKKVLLNASTERNSFYNVYNVGQGSLTALCRHNNQPLLYIDLGGGCYKNAHTYRKTLKICDTASFKGEVPPVILTHFDGDHYWTAHRAINTIKPRNWIVPNQKLSPKQLLFVKRLVSKGHKIYVFPTGLTRLNINSLTIVQCNGRTKNDSGLAVYLRPKYHDKPFQILNPGDANYRYITHIADSDLTIGGLVATHHGSEHNIRWSDIPTAVLPKRIIYSFGFGNTYGHVGAKSEKEHYKKEWVNKLSTLNGNVSFITLNNEVESPCRGKNCDLSISNGF